AGAGALRSRSGVARRGGSLIFSLQRNHLDAGRMVARISILPTHSRRGAAADLRADSRDPGTAAAALRHVPPGKPVWFQPDHAANILDGSPQGAVNFGGARRSVR